MRRFASLKDAPIAGLKRQWRDLFQTEPPAYNRKYLESRLAYKLQELRFGGLRPETRERIAALAEAFEAEARSSKGRNSSSPEQNLLAGTRLLREWQGVEHTVTVRDTGFEWEGRPYASLSGVARAITGTRWNGPLFFGMRATRRPA